MGREPFEAIDRFIDAMDRAGDLAGMLRIIEAEVRRLGFERFAYWLLWPPEGPRIPFWLTNYPDEWVLHYNQSDFKSHDVIANRAMASVRPFLWTEFQRTALTKAQRAVFEDAIDFGLRSGGNIPIHGPKNAKATFTVSNDCSDDAFSELFLARRHELHLITIYMHERVLDRGLHKVPDTASKLTLREIDVLAWSAKGKTRWEISKILFVSEDTVKKHLLNASRKLGASNKTHAISMAIARGLVIP